MNEDWGFHKPLLESFKCKLFLFLPSPGLVLLGEIVKRASEVREIPNETPVETTKAEEGMNVLEFGRGWPVLESF